jgi:transcriptional regulator with XRE-family HTH domain
MPRKSTLKLPPVNLGDETFGQRLARIRKEKGLTQYELAGKMGLVQALISEYERDKLRAHHEMVARFAIALEVSADDLLGINAPKKKHKAPSLRLQKRMLKIEELPKHQQKILLRTIDTILNAVKK